MKKEVLLLLCLQSFIEICTMSILVLQREYNEKVIYNLKTILQEKADDFIR